jgi:hypothetical protein
MSYTKGDWKVERVPIQSAGGSNTCFQIGPFKACIYDDWRQYQEYGITTLENEANARLISAAPDLLEALQEVVAISDRKHDAWDKAKAAIAKALGQ